MKINLAPYWQGQIAIINAMISGVELRMDCLIDFAVTAKKRKKKLLLQCLEARISELELHKSSLQDSLTHLLNTKPEELTFSENNLDVL